MKMKLKWGMPRKNYQRVGTNIGVKNIRDIIFSIRPLENRPMSTQRKFNHDFRFQNIKTYLGDI